VAASEVQKLPPAKTFDQQQSLNAMLTGGPAAMQADLKTQKDAADAVKREQISYLNTYTSSMSAVDAQTPSFVPPESRIGGGGSNSNSITGGTVVIPGTGGGTPNVRGTTTGAPSSKYTGVNGPNGAGAPGVSGDDNGQTDQSGYTPMPGMGTGSSGYPPPSTTPAPSTFGPSGGAGNVPGAGAGGFGGGFGSFGGAGGAGGVAGGAGGPGAGAGAGSGGNPAGRPMGPGGMGPSGPGGAGGRGGMSGAPRGKGEEEEDQEHERPSYLVEGDPESAFGNDQLTAPPVIGSDG
jgi:hypothetical protein